MNTVEIKKYGKIVSEAIEDMRQIPIKEEIEEIKRIFYETMLIQNERVIDILDTISKRLIENV